MATNRLRFGAVGLLIGATLAVLVLKGPATSIAQEGQSPAPDEVIQAAASGILSAMDGQRDALAGDPEALFQVVETHFLPHFDRAYAAFLVLGKHGRSASKEQRRRFTDALYRYVLRQYASGLLEFTSDRLEVLPLRGKTTKKKTSVKTQVFLDDGTAVPVNYSLRLTDRGWKVYDVTIEGISYVKNFRTQLGSEIQSRGLDAVIGRLEGSGSPSPEETS